MQEEFRFDISARAEKPARKAVPHRRCSDAGGRQLILPGYEQTRADNLFFAIRPDRPASCLIDGHARELAQKHGLRGDLLGTERYHITQRGLGTFDGVPAGTVTRAREAAQSVEMTVFEVCFDRVGSFARKDGLRPLVLLGSDGQLELREFHRRLGEAMRWAGLKRVRSAFTPHITLLYDSQSIAETAITPIRWIVRGFVLIHSPQGWSKHIELGLWGLQRRSAIRRDVAAGRNFHPAEAAELRGRCP